MDVLGLVDPVTGLVHSDALGRAGVDRHALDAWLATGLLLRMSRGSFVAASTWQRLDEQGRHLLHARCALTRRQGAVLAAVSAATVHGLPLPPYALPAAPVLLRPRSAARPERGSGGATRSRRAWLAPDEVTVGQGLPVTTTARTVVDLARSTTTPWALAAADAALTLPGTTRSDLEAAADVQPRAPGHRRAVFCAAHADPRAESPLESAGRAVILVGGLPTPTLQAWVSGASGARYRLDMLLEQWWVAVEVDGRTKYLDASAADRVWADKRRQDDLVEAGLEVVRLVAADIGAPAPFLARLLRAVHRAHIRRGLTPPTLPAPAGPPLGRPPGRLGTRRSRNTP